MITFFFAFVTVSLFASIAVQVVETVSSTRAFA
jgi:hypothetical protein